MKRSSDHSIKENKKYNLFKSQVHVLAVMLIFKSIRHFFETNALITSEDTPSRIVGVLIEILAFPLAFILLSLFILIGIGSVVSSKPASMKKKYYTLLGVTGVIVFSYMVIPLLVQLMQN